MKNIATALVKAQKAFGPALKVSTNPAFQRNGKGGKYADLASCIDAVIDALNNNGIALIQQNEPHPDGVVVETVFIHESGEMLNCGKLFVPADKHNPQGYGSALTYARRYSLMSACGIAPEDDDGNASSLPKKPIVLPALAPNRLEGAIKQIKAGNYTIERLHENFAVTPEQNAQILEALADA
jgi:hypothetical protein